MKHFDLKFGADVHGHDKKLGQLQKLVIEPKTTRVTHFIVAQGLIFKQATVIPLDIVEDVQPERVTLPLLSGEEVAHYPAFEEHTVRAGVPEAETIQGQGGKRDPYFPSLDPAPAAGTGFYVEESVVRQGVDDEALLWDEHTAIHGHQGRAGQLSHVIINAVDHRIHQLIMSRGKLLEQYLAIPSDTIEQISESTIQIAMNNKEIDGLSEYANSRPPEPAADSDTELSSPLEAKEPSIGNLLTELTARLAEDPRTEAAVIELICDRGVVTLTGIVADQETKQAAAAIVDKHPDVITVHNNLQVSH